MRRLIAIAAIAAAVVMPSAALAWGHEGHEVVALIAASELSPAAKAQVEQLLGGDAASTMADVSTWADKIRRDRPQTGPWHYVNIEITSGGYDAARDCPNDACVVAQIRKDAIKQKVTIIATQPFERVPRANCQAPKKTITAIKK